MTQSTAGKITGLLLSGLAATGMFTVFGSAPIAQASCISAFGISSSPECSSGFGSVAIAIGNTTTAHADGFLGLAFTFGNNSDAFVNGPASIAFNIGEGKQVYAGDLFRPGLMNVAINLGGSTGYSRAEGSFFNLAVNLGGLYSSAFAGEAGTGYGNLAIGVLNTNTGVVAGPGPLAAAIGLFQNNPSFSFSVVKQEPGININGLKLPNTAASTPSAAATRRSVERPAAASTAKTPRSAAASRNR